MLRRGGSLILACSSRLLLEEISVEGLGVRSLIFVERMIGR